MPTHDRMALLVEAPDDTVRLIRVTGRLDVGAAASVLRMVGAQLELVATRHRVVTDLVLDLSGVTTFEVAGLRSLRHARFAAAQRGIAVHLCGFGARHHLLPAATHRALLAFRSFPTAEIALQELTGVRPPPDPIVVPAPATAPEVTIVGPRLDPDVASGPAREPTGQVPAR